MNFPFFKLNSSVFSAALSSLDYTSRLSFSGEGVASKAIPPVISKAVFHLAWLKETSRGFCEADELAF